MSASRQIAAQDHPFEREGRRESTAALRSPGYFGRHPFAGVFLFFIGSLVFGYFAYDLFTNGPFLYWDKAVAVSLTAYGRSHLYLKPIVDIGFYLGSWVMVVLGLFLTLYFIIHKSWEELFMLLAGMIGDLTLFEGISTYVGRPRPPQQMWIILKIPGFPSGHVMASVVFFGLLAYLAVPHVRSPLVKALVIFLSIFFMLYVGFSRVFTAAHYLTDVLAGYGLGLAWASVIFPMIEIYYRDRRSKNGKKRQAPPFTTDL